jgi:hypothetical protein
MQDRRGMTGHQTRLPPLRRVPRPQRLPVPPVKAPAPHTHKICVVSPAQKRRSINKTPGWQTRTCDVGRTARARTAAFTTAAPCCIKRCMFVCFVCGRGPGAGSGGSTPGESKPTLHYSGTAKNQMSRRGPERSAGHFWGFCSPCKKLECMGDS